jgi:hypothetical protein
MSGKGFIAQQPDEVCEMCGKVDECRPYGPNDENICFNCAMTKVGEETVKKKMAAYIFGETDANPT